MSNLYEELLGEFMPKVASTQEVKNKIEGLNLSIEELEALANEVGGVLTKESADESDEEKSKEESKEKEDEPKTKTKDEKEDEKEKDENKTASETDTDDLANDTSEILSALLKEASEAEEALEVLAQERAEEILKEAGFGGVVDLVKEIATKLSKNGKMLPAQAQQAASKIIAKAQVLAGKTGKSVSQLAHEFADKISGANPFAKKADETDESETDKSDVDVEEAIEARAQELANEMLKEAGFNDSIQSVKVIAEKLIKGAKMLPAQAEQAARKIMAQAQAIAQKTGKNVSAVANELVEKITAAKPSFAKTQAPSQVKTAREELKDLVKNAIMEQLK